MPSSCIIKWVSHLSTFLLCSQEASKGCNGSIHVIESIRIGEGIHSVRGLPIRVLNLMRYKELMFCMPSFMCWYNPVIERKVGMLCTQRPGAIKCFHIFVLAEDNARIIWILLKNLGNFKNEMELPYYKCLIISNLIYLFRCLKIFKRPGLLVGPKLSTFCISSFSVSDHNDFVSSYLLAWDILFLYNNRDLPNTAITYNQNRI